MTILVWNIYKKGRFVEQVDEKTRQSMYKLRQTWSRLFPAERMYALDIQIATIDPAWPLTAPKPEPTSQPAPVGNIHVNPRFLKVDNPYTAIEMAGNAFLDAREISSYVELVGFCTHCSKYTVWWSFYVMLL